MGNHSMTKFDLLIETHQGLKRQGPGSPEMTLRALSFISHLDGFPIALTGRRGHKVIGQIG